MAFVAGRVAALVPVLALVLAIVFSLVRAIPGDPAGYEGHRAPSPGRAAARARRAVTAWRR
ncbi:MAG: ABC transporter permease, partial [Alphaproteobacteria bacterium]